MCCHHEQGPLASFVRTPGTHAKDTLCALLGVPAQTACETVDPGWMVRVLAPFTVRNGNGEDLVLNTTQDLVAFWAKDARVPVWWGTDSF